MANNWSPRGRPTQSSIQVVGDLINKARLAWRLLRDERVPVVVKAIPLMGLLYLIWPVDLLPDLFPALGQLDDVAIILLALNWFIKACPTEVVNDIQNHVEEISARYTVIDDRDRRGSE